MFNRKNPFVFFLSFCFYTLFVIPAQAEQTPGLDLQSLEKWADAQRAFVKWGAENRDALNKARENHAGNSAKSPLQISAVEMLEPLAKAGLYGSAEKLIVSRGYNSLEQWAEHTLRITRAAAAAQFAEKTDALDMDKLIALKNSGTLTDREAAEIDAAIRQNKAITEFLRDQVPEADRNAIKPHLKMLGQALNGR